MVFADPSKVDLPSPGRLVELYFPPGHTLYLGRSDMENYYHRLQMANWILEFFDLSATELDGVQKTVASYAESSNGLVELCVCWPTSKTKKYYIEQGFQKIK